MIHTFSRVTILKMNKKACDMHNACVKYTIKVRSLYNSKCQSDGKNLSFLTIKIEGWNFVLYILFSIQKIFYIWSLGLSAILPNTYMYVYFFFKNFVILFNLFKTLVCTHIYFAEMFSQVERPLIKIKFWFSLCIYEHLFYKQFLRRSVPQATKAKK